MMAKSLVRNRHAVNKLFQLKSQLQAVSLRIAVSGAAVGGTAYCLPPGQCLCGCRRLLSGGVHALVPQRRSCAPHLV